jgi:hypothetical protein
MIPAIPDDTITCVLCGQVFPKYGFHSCGPSREHIALMEAVIEAVRKVVEGPSEDEYDGSPSLVNEFDTLMEYRNTSKGED